MRLLIFVLFLFSCHSMPKEDTSKMWWLEKSCQTYECQEEEAIKSIIDTGPDFYDIDLEDQ